MSRNIKDKPICANETDEFTRRRMDAGQFDHCLNLDIAGVRIGNTGMIRWHIVQNGDIIYDEQYVADVLEKVVQVIRENDADTSIIDDD